MEQYAALAFRVASVSEDGVLRVLAENQLDMASWKAELSYWEARLSASLDDDDGDELPVLVADYTRGVQTAQRLQAGPAIPLCEYVVVLREVQKGQELGKILARRGWSLAQYLTAHGHWLSEAGSDESVRRAIVGLDTDE